MPNEIAIASDWASLKEQATALVKSGFLPPAINTPEKAIALAMAGKELGVGMMEAMRSINIIQGKPTISPQLMLALANRSGQLQDIRIDATDERCVVTVTRRGRAPHTETFGVKEATALGLIGRDNYIKQRATMFKWRSLAANLRVTFPDVMLGFYTPEEMGAEVKVTDSEDMEIVSVPEEGINLGIRVPKNYWDLRDSNPEEAQKLLGEDCYPQKVQTEDPKKTGWYIFSRENKKAEEFVKTLGTKAESSVPKEEYITHDEQLELFSQCKQKGISQASFKKALKEVFGVDGTAKIKKEDYSKVYEWIVRNEQDAVE